jgi:hypothetical protein
MNGQIRMSNKLGATSDTQAPSLCQIRIRGHLDPEWAGWFGGLTITLEEDGATLLAGVVVDQAALYGLLRKVRDLGMPLISVHCAAAVPAGGSNVTP